MTSLNNSLPFLPPNTIVPTEGLERTFVQYLMRLYEDISFNVNARDYTYFTISISDVATNIPNLPTFGAFLICVSGTVSTLPTGVWALAKSDSTVAGAVTPIQLQVGTGTWAGINLALTSTASNFQIAHGLAATTANFNIRIVGTAWGG